jgi:hypothetical protein
MGIWETRGMPGLAFGVFDSLFCARGEFLSVCVNK